MTQSDREFWQSFRLVALLIVLGIAGLVGSIYAGRNVEISKGVRDGKVRKVSDTGLIWTTCEAEVMSDGLMVPETFQYTVRDPEVADTLRRLPIGTKVRVHYRKYLTVWVPNGESRYVITGIEYDASVQLRPD